MHLFILCDNCVMVDFILDKAYLADQRFLNSSVWQLVIILHVAVCSSLTARESIVTSELGYHCTVQSPKHTS